MSWYAMSRKQSCYACPVLTLAVVLGRVRCCDGYAATHALLVRSTSTRCPALREASAGGGSGGGGRVSRGEDDLDCYMP
eukprot:1070843-Rhodomonas_salina.4